MTIASPATATKPASAAAAVRARVCRLEDSALPRKGNTVRAVRRAASTVIGLEALAVGGAQTFYGQGGDAPKARAGRACRAAAACRWRMPAAWQCRAPATRHRRAAAAHRHPAPALGPVGAGTARTP